MLRNRENGLMSRFGCYVVNSRMDFDDHVWDVEEEGNMLQRQFFQMLPTDFTKQEAIEQAQVLGVNVRTMENWIEKMIKQSSIERVMKGMYQKITCQIA